MTTLQWAVGMFCALLGALMLVAPHQFSGPLFSALPADSLWMGSLFLLAGASLIAVPVLGGPRSWVIASHFAATAALLVLVYNNVLLRFWGATDLYGVLALGTILAPVASGLDERRRPRRFDYFALVFGAVCASYGALRLLLPQSFAAPTVSPTLPAVWLYGSTFLVSNIWMFGAAFLIAGAALMVVQFLPGLPRMLYRAAHLGILAPCLSYAAVASIPLLAWTGIFLYIGFGLLVASLPWTGQRLSSLDPRSFSVRLAFLLALAVAVPSIVIVGVVTSGQERAERDIAFRLLLGTVLVAAVAGTLMARRLTGPLAALSRATSRLAHGDSVATLPRGGSSEIEALVSTFGDMRDTLAARAAEREHLTRELAERVAELQALLETAPVAVWIAHDPECSKITGNVYADRIMQAPQGGNVSLSARPDAKAVLYMVARDGVELRPDELPAQLACATGKPVGEQVLELIFSDGRRVHLLESAAPLFDAEGRVRGAVATGVDVTPIKQAEAQLERLLAAEQEAREQAERSLRLRDEFLYIAAHELKTPVTSLMGFSQTVVRKFKKRGTLDHDLVVQALTQIDQQSRRLAALAEELLDVSRLEAGRLSVTLEEVDLSSVIEAAITSVIELYPSRDFRFRKGKAVHAVVDPLRMEQLITNLLENAVKFSPQEAPIEIELAVGEQEATISVRDYGRGVPEEDRERIFERFYQAHEERHYGGLGLGLYISSQIVHVHGGTITCEAPEGRGSLFVIRLPLGRGHELKN